MPQVAEKQGWPEPLGWSVALKDKDDLERFKELYRGLRTWDFWDWNDCDKRFGDDWPGCIHNLLVIEDAAQGVNATYKGRYLGTIGHLGAYSFHETKNFICGEGGALVINDERFIERAEIIREKGTNRSKFSRGEVDKYTWVDIGSSYLPSEIIAAFLYAQLEEADVITRKRWAIFNYYVKQFTPLQERGLLSIPSWPLGCRHNAHMFYLILPDNSTRNNLLSYLKQEGIHAVFHYIPHHTSPMGLKMRYKEGDLPITEDLSARLMRIPCFFELKQEDQDRIFEAVTTFFATKGGRLSHIKKMRAAKVGLTAIQ